MFLDVDKVHTGWVSNTMAFYVHYIVRLDTLVTFPLSIGIGLRHETKFYPGTPLKESIQTETNLFNFTG